MSASVSRFLTVLGLLSVCFAETDRLLDTPYYRSRPSSTHSTSNNRFAVAYETYQSKLTKTEAVRNPNERRQYVLEFEESCQNCHQKILTKLQSGVYNIVDKSHAIVFSSPTEIEAYNAQYQDGHNIVQFQAQHPLDKIDPRIAELIDEDCVLTESASHFTSKFTSPKEIYQTLLRGHAAENNVKPMATSRVVDVGTKILISPQISLENMQTLVTFLTTELTSLFGETNVQVSFDTTQAFDRRMVAMLTIKDCSIAASVLTLVATRDEVQYIERSYKAVIHNRWARGLCDSGDFSSTPLIHVGTAGITGANEIIGIADSGIDMSSCYFHDSDVALNYQTANGPTVLNTNHRKVIQYVAFSNAVDDDGHGTHVSGIAAGNTQDSELAAAYNGMAPDSKIAFFDIGAAGTDDLDLPVNLETGLFDKLYASGARVFTNSWGTDSNVYDAYAADVDSFMYNNPDTLVLFSAGNSGDDGAGSVKSPSVNKNGISVGASANDRVSWITNYNLDRSYLNKDSVAHFSSVGPTADQRLKPDLLATGYLSVSAYLSGGTPGEYHCNNEALQGTSMAAPTAAGYAIKVRQYFTLGFYPSGTQTASDGFIPSGALMKAILVHSGNAMARVVDATDGSVTSVGSYPSTILGYGRIQMSNVLNFGVSTSSPLTMFAVGSPDSASSHYAEVSTTTTTKSYVFTTDAASSQHDIRITLSYTDLPGTPGAGAAMMNVLTVSASDNHGNNFAMYQASGTVKSNLQVIDIGDVMASTTYTVTITATSLVTTVQPFALVVTGQTTYLPQSDDYYDNSSDNDSAISTPFGALSWYALILFGFFICVGCCVIEGCIRQCHKKKETQRAVVIEMPAQHHHHHGHHHHHTELTQQASAPPSEI